MASEPSSLPLFWRGAQVGVVRELNADMFWFHARWEPGQGAEVEAFLAQVEEGEDPEVVIQGSSPLRLIVTAATPEELELKTPG